MKEEFIYTDNGITLQQLIELVKEKGLKPKEIKLLSCGCDTVTVVINKQNNIISLDCQTLFEDDLK